MNITLAQKHHDLHVAQAKKLAEITRDLQLDDPITIERPTGVTAGGDERRLRGIPVVGAKGVGGAIPGSRPGANLR